MLDDAVRYAKEGRAVYVMVARHSHKLDIVASRGDELDRLGIKVEVPGSSMLFDWRTMRVPGSHSNCVFLVDHWAIEQKFGRILEMLHRYDAPATNERGE